MRTIICIFAVIGVGSLVALGCAGDDTPSGDDTAGTGAGTGGDSEAEAGVSGSGGTPGTDSSVPPGPDAATCSASSQCDDGLFCNGAEMCDAQGRCQRGEDPCDDGVACTNDSCDEQTNSCANVADESQCDDGLFCNGVEICDATDGCQAAADPCDDGVDCTDDSCDEDKDACENLADDDLCNDGLFCNGEETCDAVSDCQDGSAPDCDDGVDCTGDSCNEKDDKCDNAPDDGECDNGVFCDGDEVCDAVSDCQPAAARDCNDGVDCTDDSCNEGEDRCDNLPNQGACVNLDFCDGVETCDAVNGCQAGADPCDDGVDCTSDSCDEGVDSCGHAPDDGFCDDDVFCNGAETCDAISDCQAGTDPCNDTNLCTDDDCNENDHCINVNNAADCDDNNPCTVNDKCAGGSCSDTVARDCSDPNVCTTDGCNPADLDGDPCTHDANTDDCDDGNPCTVNDKCTGGSCSDTDALDCSDPNICTTDGCNPADLDGDPCTHVNNENPCEDGSACTIDDACSDGACVGGPPLPCDDLNDCTSDGCNPSTGCTVVNNTADCDDDNPCTVNDKCSGGLCQDHDPLDCGDGDICTDDDCNPADLDGDPCFYTNNQAPCDDENSCTATDACSDGGCVGSDNACGPYANGCSEGVPNTCSCITDYKDNGAGACVPDTDECDPSPCDANATCFDPTSDPGNVVCTCDYGYTGNGITCADIDECAGDPCGIGDSRASACTQPEPGTYGCVCNAGFTAVDDGSGANCVCDMNGIFAIRIATRLSWSGIAQVEDGEDTVYSWAIRSHSYSSDGTLSAETVACGGVTSDLCGTGNLLIGPEAYGQFMPNHIYELTTMPTDCTGGTCPEMALPLPLAGESFLTPETSSLLGIALTDPFGNWPATRQNVSGGSGEQTNGATWVDHDDDGTPGVTSYGVPPGGSGSLLPDIEPPFAYGATSPTCPRSDPEADRLGYAWWPGIEGFLTLRRVKRFHLAARMISALDGDFISCDRIDGNVIGPDAGKFHSDARFHSCIRCASGSSSSCSDAGCSGALVDFYDGQSQTEQQVEWSTFVIKRIDDSYDCADVRAENFDPVE